MDGRYVMIVIRKKEDEQVVVGGYNKNQASSIYIHDRMNVSSDETWMVKQCEIEIEGIVMEHGVVRQWMKSGLGWGLAIWKRIIFWAFDDNILSIVEWNSMKWKTCSYGMHGCT